MKLGDTRAVCQYIQPMIAWLHQDWSEDEDTDKAMPVDRCARFDTPSSPQHDAPKAEDARPVQDDASIDDIGLAESDCDTLTRSVVVQYWQGQVDSTLITSHESSNLRIDWSELILLPRLLAKN